MGSSKTILVVDDDRDVQFALGAILNYDGYHVVEAGSGEEAVELARASIPDLVLMDIRMPGMSGFEAARRIHAEEGTRNVPIVALTGELLDDPASEARARALFHSVLHKPIQPTTLVQHIRTIIGRP